MSKLFCPEPNCPDVELEVLDIPAARKDNEGNLFQCVNCGNVFRKDEDALTNVSNFFQQVGRWDDRLLVAISAEHRVNIDSIMQAITRWRAVSEMETLTLIGIIQQRLGILDNRLHSIKKRLAMSLLGEPTPLDTEEMLRLIDECIDLASPTPPKERGVEQKAKLPEV